MFAANYGKYKNIIVSIALFLILDASVLTLNFYMSFQIAKDAIDVNLAGRQRMLSQRTVKSLLDLDYSGENVADRQKAMSELQLAVGLFDQTLASFDKGGLAKGADGTDLQLAAVSSSGSKEAIAKAKVIWEPYKAELEKVFSASEAQLSAAVAGAIVYARSNNIQLLKLMNDLTVDLEGVARSKAGRLRTIQTVGISLAIINFFIILFHFIGQLKDGDRKLDIARQETTKILDTVNEGLFLIDKNLIIASQYSKNVPLLFGRNEMAGLSLERLLADLVSEKDMETSKRFIGLLFREEIKSNLIRDLNPLKEIEVNISDHSGGYISRYLSFEFARAFEEGTLKNILITVNDVTEKVELEIELEKAREQTEQQLEVLTGILHTNPGTLRRFVDGCFDSFDRINVMLKTPAKSDKALRMKLDGIFTEVHTFKGESGALGLDGFQELAHKFESDIGLVKNKNKVTGDDFFPLVVQLEKLMKHAETVKSLSEKLVAFGVETGRESSRADEWSHLKKLAESVAARHGKDVELVMCGLTEVSLDDEVKKLVSEVSVQCIRNAVVHGIEEPVQRVAARKPKKGRVELRLFETASGGLELNIIDDGKGIDYESIRNRAVELGLYSRQELERWGHKQLVSLIFEPSFSTSDSENLDAGRGVGMNVIRESIKRFEGKIRISSRKGLSTQFIITIPQLVRREIAA